MERTATAWLALSSVDEANGAIAVGMVLAARMVPSLLFGLAAGTLADRIYRPRLVRAVTFGGMLLMALFAWLVSRGPQPLWLVLVISLCAGMIQTLDSPSRQALAVDTVPRTLAPNALALHALAGRLLAALGAFIAGGLIALLGVAACYVAIAVAFGASALLISALRVPRTSIAHSERPSFGQALGEAARLVVSNSRVRTLTIASVACEVFAFSYNSAVPILARDVLNAGPEGFGMLNSAAALGGSLAILALLAVPSRVPREPILATVFLVFGLALLTLSQVRDLLVTAAVLFVVGACAAGFDTLQQTLIQLAVPEHQRGRAVGVWMLGIGSSPFGHMEMGLVAGSIGAPGALLINGAIVLISATTLLGRAPAYRWRALGARRN